MQVAALGAVAGAAAWAVRGRSSQVFAPSAWRGSPARPVVALTFDDGPSESTPALLDLLARESVRATFFQCGANAERLPSVARAVSEAGHETGNHTHTHAALYGKSPAFIRTELSRAQAALARIHGVAPRWFRAPYGCRWFGLRRAQRELGLRGVMWTTLARDWKLAAGSIANRVVRLAGPGAIVCLHDGRELRPNPDVGATIKAVQLLLPRLRERGFSFVTLSEMLCQTSSSNE